MGDGNMGIEDYLRTYVQKCPGKPVSLEVIVTATFRIFNYHDPQAWEIFKTTPAWEFSRVLTLADRGIPKPLPAPPPGRRPQPNPDARRRNPEAVDASSKGTKEFLATLSRPPLLQGPPG